MSKQLNTLKVTVYWGDILYDTVMCEQPGQSVTVGAKEGNRFVIAGTESIELVRLNADGTAEIKFSERLDGHIKRKDGVMSLATARDQKKVQKNSDGLYTISLSPGEKADVVIGHMSFFFDWTKERTFIAKSNIEDRKLFIKNGLIPLACFISLGLFALLMPLPEPELPPERIVEILSTPPKQYAKAAMGERQSEDGGAAKGDMGKAALKAEEKPSVADSLKNANLGALVSGLTNIGASAPDTSNQGAKASATQEGTGGFSTRGLAAGGGGKSMGIGRQVGEGLGGFEGTGRLGLSGNSLVEGGTGHGDTSVNRGGGLDRDVIESIIRRRQDRIRLCYERQLTFNPKLAGKISVHFVIGKTGQVMESGVLEDTMRNASVRDCILTEVKDWTFPAPEGGTLVNVDYPFVFESSSKI